eukprot:TRINITY_DN24065_c0_g1_i1.p1 TRINITY_DN24065_c0_g1~~TRINITY_DN24065_c0_g1_i1.p1  ORF type:complete len:584 (+),score=207.80 TRINITY_DN24065_c0_g1_i1:170-1921(+)
MAPSLVYRYQDQRATAAGSKTEAIRQIKNLEAVAMEAEEKMGIYPGTYDFFDLYGQVRELTDLQRAIKMAGEEGECVLELREHRQFIKIRSLEEENGVLTARLQKLENHVRDQEHRFDQKILESSNEVKAMIRKTDKKIADEIMPALQGLMSDRAQMQREMRVMQEKLGEINIEEIKAMCQMARDLNEEVKNCIRRIEYVDQQFQKEKQQLGNDQQRIGREMKDLQRFMQGKLDILMEADADLKRETQLNAERLALTQDDLRLLQEELQRLTNQCSGALEESEELRDLLGTVREDNALLKSQQGSMMVRVNCLEGTATEKWEGFWPGILYFRKWHTMAKGIDVQLSADTQIAIGRGPLAATGVVLASDEGLALADGPSRRFGTPGSFQSYFEIEVDEIVAAPEGAGGIFVGFSLQSAAEVAAHPKKEFDGWMMGGNAKALVTRQGTPEGMEDQIPQTYLGGQPGDSEEAKRRLKDAKACLQLLRAAMPIVKVGQVRELGSFWQSGSLRMGDRIGVLFRCNRDGGARMRIAINGIKRAEHDFLDAPPAEAIGFLTPVIRLAGSTKAAKLLPGLAPSAKILADDD